MKEYALILTVLAAVVAGGLWAVATRVDQAPEPRVCTMEVKQCADGSYVGRTGANCEFTPCPAAAATTTAGGSILPYQSGVRGTVTLGPTCPVERIPLDPACAPKPFATAITVYHAGVSTPFIIGNSDSKGTFRFALPPGDYVLKAGSGGVLPRCADATVTVPPSGDATTAISCDSGIR